MRICPKCNIEKDDDCFYKRKNGSLLTPCKDCKIKYETEKYIENKNDPIKIEKIKKKNKKYYDKNKDSLLKKSSKYYVENKEYYQEYQKEYQKTHPRKLRKKSKPSVKDRIRSNVSRSISKAIKKNGSIKNSSIIKYLSFSFSELILHLENQFEPWMNWSNYGMYNPNTWDDNNSSTWTWQIDHIIPHSNFKYTSMEDDAFKKCWTLSNLRPYSAKQNILDQNRKIAS